MRLHHLAVTAFGPFAERVDVDFDALSAAGLFLLAGPTGAGKSSVLDAVCFALYGAVPGDRNDARRLRCDTAPAGVPPQVVLEVTLSGRRFRITRAPAWERPKKRGSGTTTQQASVSVQERVDGEWQHLSNRLDETGHLVTELVGMNLAQFCQVAMLPQGRFQAFLRARTEDRQKLLQQLFRTGRFASIEHWLRDHRAALRRESVTHQQAIAGVVHRVSEVADRPMPDEWDEDDLAPQADGGAIVTWAGAVTAEAGRDLETVREILQQAERAEVQAAQELAAARTLAAHQSAHADAVREADELACRAAAVDATRARAASARAASPVTAVLRLSQDAEAAHAAAWATAENACAAVAEQLGVPRVAAPDVDAALGDAETRLARAGEVQPDERRLAALVEELAELGAQLEHGRSATEVARARLVHLPARLEAATAARDAATEAERALPAAAGRLATLGAAVAAARDAAALEVRLSEARAGLAVAVDTCQQLKEEWLSLREARLEGMAAEIAGALAVGACCPVCGSAEHPRPATPGPDAPDAAAERAARKRLDDAEAARVAHDDHVRDVGTRLALARQAAGGADERALAQELDAARAEADRLGAVAGTLPDRERELESLESALDEARRTLADGEVGLAALEARLAATRDESSRIRERIDALLAGSGAGSVHALLNRLARHRDHLLRARAALAEAGRTGTVLAQARAALATAATECGFASAEEAVAAVLSAAEVERLEREVAGYDERRRTVVRLLADSDLVAAADREPPDVVGAQAAHERATAGVAQARTRYSMAAARTDRLGRLAHELAERLTAWAPVRQRFALADRVAAFVEGRSPENRWRVRLSAYVLAYRLTQVVAAANVRLARMSDGRYALEHTGQRGARDTRGGLGLLVRDDWSGEARDPVTLSGGETFVVSLALALGLADVVTQEAGGADIDTLFVDEGFGSLDSDTLDDVMDTLDTLRDGGRVVGVVSHVAELRTRIPTQLRVDKHRSGSTLEVLHGGG